MMNKNSIQGFILSHNYNNGNNNSPQGGNDIIPIQQSYRQNINNISRASIKEGKYIPVNSLDYMPGLSLKDLHFKATLTGDRRIKIN